MGRVGVHPSLQPRPWELRVEHNRTAAGPMPSLGEQDGGWAQGSYHLWAPSRSSQPRRLSPTSREAPPLRALQGSGEPDAGSCPTGSHSPACSQRTAFVTFLTCCHWFSVCPSLACGVGCKQPQQPPHGGVRRRLQAAGHPPANRVGEAEGAAAAGGRAGWTTRSLGPSPSRTGLSLHRPEPWGSARRGLKKCPNSVRASQMSNRDRAGVAGATRSRQWCLSHHSRG